MIGDLFLKEIFFEIFLLQVKLFQKIYFQDIFKIFSRYIYLKIHSVLAFLTNVDRIFSPFDSKQFVEKFSIVYSPNLHKLAR